MEEVGVVILNYNAYQETIRCAESILTQKKVNLHLVIVDNGSRNESLLKLKECFKEQRSVTIFSSEENLGFAKGNNIGISWLQKQGIEFIFVANSDVLFSTDDILYTMLSKYEKGTALLNPVVKNLDGTAAVRIEYKKKFLYLRLMKTFIKALFEQNKISTDQKEKASDINEKKNSDRYGIQHSIYTVTGCAFMLTPDFFRYYKGLFPETFLYGEEYATILFIHKAELRTGLIETSPIIHTGAASTPEDMKKSKQIRKKIGRKSNRKITKLIFMSKDSLRRKY